MNFIDHTGHLFTLPSYSTPPIGYEFEVQPYIFWLNAEHTSHLSVENYYIETVRMHFDKFVDIKDIRISISDEEFGYLISPGDIHDQIYKIDINNNYIELIEDNFKKTLSMNELVGIEENGLVMFYIAGYSKEPGTIITNGIIEVTYIDETKEWCPFSIGGEFVDENETLIINGKNMGISLPKDILGAIYQTSYNNEIADESMYALKLKEYFMEFMHIKGQVGNFNSILAALKWFGYGELVEVQKLFQTDNQFQDQFFLDDFGINPDLLIGYQNFRPSTYISLRLKENQELDEVEPQDYGASFWGEGKPKMENLFKKIIYKTYDEGDIKFYRTYYDWTFVELGLKLAMVDYYFKKYFMPLHLSIHSTSIAHQVHANDIKLLSGTSVHEYAGTILCRDEKTVNFMNDKSVYYIYNQKHYTDLYFNDIRKNGQPYFKQIGEHTAEEVLYMNEPCVEIPIRFSGDGYFRCHLILMKDGKCVYESDFSFIQDHNIRYNSFVILPKYINDENNQTKNYWLESEYQIALLCNDSWYYHKFYIKMPEMQVSFGTLSYQYYASLNNPTRIDLNDDENKSVRHKYGYEFDRKRWGEDVPNIDVRYILNANNSLHKQLNRLTNDSIDFNSFMYVPSLVEVNDINFYDKTFKILQDVNGEKSDDIKSTGILTRRTILNAIKKKSYITDFTNNGIKFDDRLLIDGDVIDPVFYFNDYTRDKNGDKIPNSIPIINYWVDIYFGFFTNYEGVEKPFAKKKVVLIQDGLMNPEYLSLNHYNPIIDDIYIRLGDWDVQFAGEDGKYEILKESYKDELAKAEAAWKGPGQFDPFKVDLKFKINECVLGQGQQNFVLRFVWNIELEDDKFTPSYDMHGIPREGYYKDIRMPLIKKDLCTHSNCFVVQAGLKCKFKEYRGEVVDVEYDYSNVIREEFDPNSVLETSHQLIEDNVNLLIDKAQNSTNIVDNNDYLNRIHIYNIYHLGYKGKIDKLTDTDIYEKFNTPEIDALYYKKGSSTCLFEQGPSDIVPLKYNKQKYGDYRLSYEEYKKNQPTYEKNLINLYKRFFSMPDGFDLFKWPVKSYFDYDFYLMHDDTQWYVVFISQMPISVALAEELVAPKSFDGDDCYIDPWGHGFKLEHYRSGNNFLINRMYFEDAKGVNHFGRDRIIVGTVDNVNFPVVLNAGSKWEITPMSLGVSKEDCQVFSESNSCIMSIGNKSSRYVKGYYDIDVRYSIDGNVQHQQIAKTRIRID